MADSPTTRFEVSLLIEIIAQPVPTKSFARLDVVVLPAEMPQQTKLVNYKFKIETKPIQVNISEPLIATANRFLQDIINFYIDEDRELKTLLNYGEDNQSVVLAQRRGPIDVTGLESIQLKLLQPVPDDVTINAPVFLSREVAKTVIDKVRVRFTPEIDTTPYLRPKNLKVRADIDTGKTVRNVTLNKLTLQSGSMGVTDNFQNKNFEDQIFRQWYSYDFNSSELNIDFTTYDNFIFYSSAAMRLLSFKEKLRQVEKLESLREQILSNYANTSSVAILFLQEKSSEYSLQKENIIRSFDRYEQYLFFTPSGSTSAYSASFDYVDGGTEYNSLGYWPKSGSVLYPVSSEIAVNWFNTQLEIAQRFDEFNENNLINTIPSYLREDDNNGPYFTFVTMIGQMFDNIKLYIDRLPDIYSRNLNPNEELSKDLINEIAESLGFTLPTVESVYNLTDNILGTESSEPRRDLAAEIYKRLLHNLPFFAKSKGTKTALQTLLNTFGITPQLLPIRETGTPSSISYKVFDEYTTVLDFDEEKTSYVRIPIAISNRNPTTLQLNCTIAKNSSMTILTGDNKWALNVASHPTNELLGRFEISSGSSNTTVVSSSYYPIFGEELLQITIKNYLNTSSFYFTQVEGEDIIFNQTVTDSVSFYNMWQSTDYVFLGGAGSRVISRFDGTIDEVRLWGIPLSDEVILNTAFDPGSNAGDTYTDASNYLFVQLSFNNVDYTTLLSNTIKNESPYKDINVSPSIDTLFCFNVAESDFVRYSRKIKQYTPIAGTTAYVTDKIVVAPPPKFISDSNGLRLYRTKSIVAPEQKRFYKGRNKVILAVSPTDIVNDNIIRNLGLENINAIIGAPTILYQTFDKSLQKLKKHYQQYYYVAVNTNRYIRILSDLSSVLNQVVGYFIPSRATLLSGIIIEPNILEQVKIPSVKKLRFYGKDTRKTINAPGSLTGSVADYGATFNLSDNIENSEVLPSAQYATYTAQSDTLDIVDLTGTANKYDALLDVTKIAQPTASISNNTVTINAIDLLTPATEYKTYSGEINNIIVTEITSSFSTFSTTIEFINQESVTGSYDTIKSLIKLGQEEIPGLSETAYNTYWVQHYPYGSYSGPDREVFIDTDIAKVNKIGYNDVNNGSPGAEPYNRLYTRKLFTNEIQTPRNGGVTSIYTPALYDIPPSADFRDFGVYTFFNNDEGVYYFNEIKKIPTYQSPLNATWDFDTQRFTNITSWSYGSTYNKFDVVYQDLSSNDVKDLNIESKLSIIGGNKRYYVFKTRPAYKQPTDGTFAYSGSVSSYTPPCLDRENWDVLRFKPIQVRVPRRVVFDTYTVGDPALNNFKTTTISVDRNINIPDRFIDSFDLGAVSANAYSTGEILLQNIALLFAIQSNVSGIRLRLYRTQEARDADINRSSETMPTGAHGVLLDTTLSGVNIVEITNPIHTLVDGGNPPAGKLYYTINNLDITSKLSVILLMYYFAVEIQARVPTNYLRKHYRFFRDNSTATKRRNFRGCKNTIETTIDGLPPIQIFIGEGTDIQVSSTISGQEIITGGGGTLNVT
jgi:hypothetical protein